MTNQTNQIASQSQENNELKRNASGCPDPTAYAAIKHVDRYFDPEEYRVRKLIKTIFSVCNMAGFYVESRIVLRDTKTGKIWD